MHLNKPQKTHIFTTHVFHYIFKVLIGYTNGYSYLLKFMPLILFKFFFIIFKYFRCLFY